MNFRLTFNIEFRVIHPTTQELKIRLSQRHEEAAVSNNQFFKHPWPLEQKDLPEVPQEKIVYDLALISREAYQEVRSAVSGPLFKGLKSYAADLELEVEGFDMIRKLTEDQAYAADDLNLILVPKHRMILLTMLAPPRGHQPREDLIYAYLDRQYVRLHKIFNLLYPFMQKKQQAITALPEIISKKYYRTLNFQDLFKGLTYNYAFKTSDLMALVPDRYLSFRLTDKDLNTVGDPSRARYLEGVTHLLSIRYKGATYTFGPYRVVIDLQLSWKEVRHYAKGSMSDKVTVSPVGDLLDPSVTDHLRDLVGDFRYLYAPSSTRFFPHISADLNSESRSFRCCLGNYVDPIASAYLAGNAREIFDLMYIYLSSLTSNWYIAMDNFQISTDHEWISAFLRDRPLERKVETNKGLLIHDHKFYPDVLDYYVETGSSGSERQAPTAENPAPWGADYITPYYAHEFDSEGYDPEGYDDKGLDRGGFTRSGFNSEGYDAEGYKIDGFNRYGFDREGYNRHGFDTAGFDREGFDREGFNADHVDRQGREHPVRRLLHEDFFDEDSGSLVSPEVIAAFDRARSDVSEIIDDVDHEVLQTIWTHFRGHHTEPLEQAEQDQFLLAIRMAWWRLVKSPQSGVAYEVYTDVYDSLVEDDLVPHDGQSPFHIHHIRQYLAQSVLSAWRTDLTLSGEELIRMSTYEYQMHPDTEEMIRRRSAFSVEFAHGAYSGLAELPHTWLTSPPSMIRSTLRAYAKIILILLGDIEVTYLSPDEMQSLQRMINDLTEQFDSNINYTHLPNGNPYQFSGHDYEIMARTFRDFLYARSAGE